MPVIKFHIPPGFNVSGNGTFFDSDEVRRRLKAKYLTMLDDKNKATYVLGNIRHDDASGIVTIEINTPDTIAITDDQKQVLKDEIATWPEFMGWGVDSI